VVFLGSGRIDAAGGARAASRADSLPRKVIIASTLADFSGSLAERLALASRLVDEAALAAKQQDHGGRGLDLMVFPEFAIARSAAADARDRAVPLTGLVADTLAARARAHRTWIVAPMTLQELEPTERISNAAVLFDRAGSVAGIFRKVHPIADDTGILEGGVTPGDGFPVFDCDFGRVGILICWDMAYDDAWTSLAAGGAEIVVVPSASPQTLRPMAEALRHRYYVITSTPRDNASLFDPTGQMIAHLTQPGVLAQEIDLAYAILHWSENLHEGRALTERFGGNVGYRYSTREDTGLFWSNDPHRKVGAMIAELDLEETQAMVDRMDAVRRKSLEAPPR
jgi:predicted amidohydrolase